MQGEDNVNPRRYHYIARVSILFITVGLIAGVTGCSGAGGLTRHQLTISSSAGGSVTTPGDATFTYSAGTVVSLNATPSIGYPLSNGPAMRATLPMSTPPQPLSL